MIYLKLFSKKYLGVWKWPLRVANIDWKLLKNDPGSSGAWLAHTDSEGWVGQWWCMDSTRRIW
jgi:hypothetical protein